MTDTVFEIDVSDETFYLIFRKEEHQPERQKEFEEVRRRCPNEPLNEQRNAQRINDMGC